MAIAAEDRWVTVATPPGDQPPVRGIEEEQLLQVSPTGNTLVGAVHGLLIGQEFNWHGPAPYEAASPATAATPEPLPYRELWNEESR